MERRTESKTVQAVSAHVERTIGRIERVYRPPGAAVAVLMVAPSPALTHWTLVTAGLSSVPLSADTPAAGYKAGGFYELAIGLPAGWPLTDEALADPRFSWPLALLIALAAAARTPQGQFAEWQVFANEHSAPYAGSSRFCGALIAALAATPRAASSACAGLRTVRFLGVVPLLADELVYAHRHGGNGLAHRRGAQLSELVNPYRHSVLGGRLESRRAVHPARIDHEDARVAQLVRTKALGALGAHAAALCSAADGAECAVRRIGPDSVSVSLRDGVSALALQTTLLNHPALPAMVPMPSPAALHQLVSFFADGRGVTVRDAEPELLAGV